MTTSSALVLRNLGSPARSTPTSLIPSRLFAQQTGVAIATELLYRLLIDIIDRLIHAVRHLASKGFDELSTYVQRKVQEQRERMAAASEAAKGSKILHEVSKSAEGKDFITCPLSGQDSQQFGGRAGPPMWVRGVMDGIDEGRMHERDFWIQTHEG